MKTFSYCDAAFFKKIKDDPVLNDISNALKNNQLGTNEHVLLISIFHQPVL
ncbi:hypothetical protein AB6G21_15300 [Providencia hangzhouensis]|uniref:hypothetical protein n=1 Tax=Providencia hangzhouensis TaxID=3031799 RepID=UPI0034DD1F79